MSTIASHVAKMATRTRQYKSTIQLDVWVDIVASDLWSADDGLSWVAHAQQQAFQHYLTSMRKLATSLDKEKSHSWQADDRGTFIRYKSSLVLQYEPRALMIAQELIDRWGRNTVIFDHRDPNAYMPSVHMKETPYH